MPAPSCVRSRRAHVRAERMSGCCSMKLGSSAARPETLTCRRTGLTESSAVTTERRVTSVRPCAQENKNFVFTNLTQMNAHALSARNE
eukprot:6180590-Pleurochrysis_carterae.AAC.2